MNPVPPNSAVPATTEATHATAPNREYGPRSVPEESDSKENVAGTHWHVRREGTAGDTITSDLFRFYHPFFHGRRSQPLDALVVSITGPPEKIIKPRSMNTDLYNGRSIRS